MKTRLKIVAAGLLTLIMFLVWHVASLLLNIPNDAAVAGGFLLAAAGFVLVPTGYYLIFRSTQSHDSQENAIS